MSYTPDIAVIDTTRIETNLVAYLRARQADALALFNNGAAMKPFNFTEDNAGNLDKPNLPTLEIGEISEGELEDEDIITLGYRVSFESVVFSKSPTAIGTLSKRYANALKSLLKNIKTADLLAGLGSAVQLTPQISVETTYGQVLRNDQYSGFIQIFQIRATYRIFASSYN